MARHRKGGQAAQQQHPALQALQEAEAAQQRGERREGREAQACFEEAAARFQHALSLGLPARQHDALFGLAESLQQTAGSIVDAASSVDLASWQAEAEAHTRAAELLSRSAATYQQVLEPDGRMRVDACVNCGNALCSWAESAAALMALSPSTQQQQCVALYEQACGMYARALELEEDAATHGNRGDALMAMAQVLWEWPGRVRSGEAEACCSAALAAYEQACAMCDSSDGDDLPGLLANWGQGLCSASACVQDPARRMALLDGAIQRLAQCASFARGDPTPLVTLGDAYAAKAEVLAARILSPAGSAADTPAVDLSHMQQAVSHLQHALSEGYERALHINREHTEAVIGSAEAHAGLARLAAAASDAAAAASHLQQSAACYAAVLQAPGRVYGFRSRCDVRYNYACVLALAGRDAEAAQLVASLVACGGVQLSEAAQDPDLAGRPWMAGLWQQAAGSAT